MAFLTVKTTNVSASSAPSITLKGVAERWTVVMGSIRSLVVKNGNRFGRAKVFGSPAHLSVMDNVRLGLRSHKSNLPLSIPRPSGKPLQEMQGEILGRVSVIS
jgi:hypothetical protein